MWGLCWVHDAWQVWNWSLKRKLVKVLWPKEKAVHLLHLKLIINKNWIAQSWNDKCLRVWVTGMHHRKYVLQEGLAPVSHSLQVLHILLWQRESQQSVTEIGFMVALLLTKTWIIPFWVVLACLKAVDNNKDRAADRKMDSDFRNKWSLVDYLERRRSLIHLL